MSSVGRQREDSGARDLAQDIALLTEVLHDVVRASHGDGAVELLDEAVALGQAAREGDAVAADHLAALVAELELGRAEALVRALTRWFQLVNLAEDNERVRRLRQRDVDEALHAATPRPRRGSVREAITELARRGV